MMTRLRLRKILDSTEQRATERVNKGYKSPEEMELLYPQMLQRMVNKALEGIMTAYLGHARNGRSSGKTCGGKVTKRGWAAQARQPHRQDAA